MSSTISIPKGRRPLGSAYLEPEASKIILAQIRKSLTSLGYKVYKDHYDNIMAVNNKAKQSVNDMRKFVEDHDGIKDLHNQLVHIQNVGIKGDEMEGNEEGYWAIIHFPIVGEDMEEDVPGDVEEDVGNEDFDMSSLSDMASEDLEIFFSPDPGPRTVAPLEDFNKQKAKRPFTLTTQSKSPSTPTKPSPLSSLNSSPIHEQASSLVMTVNSNKISSSPKDLRLLANTLPTDDSRAHQSITTNKQKVTHIPEQMEEFAKSGTGSMHLEGLSVDQYRDAQVLPAGDPALCARQNSELFTYSDDYTINSRHPPEYHIHPKSRIGCTWEEGLQAIEDYDWS